MRCALRDYQSKTYFSFYSQLKSLLICLQFFQLRLLFPFFLLLLPQYVNYLQLPIIFLCLSPQLSLILPLFLAFSLQPPSFLGYLQHVLPDLCKVHINKKSCSPHSQRWTERSKLNAWPLESSKSVNDICQKEQANHTKDGRKSKWYLKPIESKAQIKQKCIMKV